MQGIDYESLFYPSSEDNNENLNDFPVIEPNSPNPYTQNEDNMFSRQMGIGPNSQFILNPQDISLKEDEEDDINYDGVNPVENDEDPYTKRFNNQKASEPSELISSTRPNSGEKGISKKKGFNTKKNYPEYWRFDATKKYWKSKISQFGEERLNKLIKESDLPEALKIPIHKPNSLSFTANVKAKDNFGFLSESLKDIFSIGKDTEDLQKQNYDAFTKIFNYFTIIGNDHLPESLQKLKDFLEMSYEDLIRMFYDSDDFTTFKEDYMTKYYDEGTKDQEGFSLLEDYGLIKVFKTLKKKRRRTLQKRP